ncbi:MAG: hypothetical protein ACI4O4_09470 [Candidatus Ventricola sp.]
MKYYSTFYEMEQAARTGGRGAVFPETQRRESRENTQRDRENTQKKSEKGVDRKRQGVYNTSSRHERGTKKRLIGSGMILENDTESRRTRDAIFTSRIKKRQSIRK